MRRFQLIFALLVFVMMSGCAVIDQVNPFPQHIYSTPPSGSRSGSSTAAYAPKTKPYTVMGVTYYPLKSASGYDQVGMASWYGRDFHGKKTATGETYNMYALSAAHKTLPLGTRVKVTNLSNGRSVYLTINDRGPFVSGRIIDLSYGAASKLGSVDKGVIKVRITAVGSAPAPQNVTVAQKRLYHVRVGAFSDKSNAYRTNRELRAAGYTQARIRQVRANGRLLHVVQAGSYSDRQQAQRVLSKLKRVFPSSYITS